MNKLWIIFLFISCSVIKPSPSPPSPPVIIIDTLIKTVHDTIEQVIAIDTGIAEQEIVVNPIVGDSYPELQAAVYFALANPQFSIYCSPGTYLLSRPLVIAAVLNGDYVQVSLKIHGAFSAKASPQNKWTLFEPVYSDAPTIVIQKGKAVTIENIASQGTADFIGNLSLLQIDTLKWSQWTDGHTRDNRNSPECFLAIDPACDPAYMDSINMYQGLKAMYLPGMSRGGSSGIEVIGCRAADYIVGIVFEPSYQQNGDISDIIDCDFESNKTDIAYGQDQSKEDHIIRLKDWGNTRCLVDGVHYGMGTGGGSVMIDGMNLAGANFELFDINTTRFPLSAENIYAENLFCIGSLGNGSVSSCDRCQIDFMNGSGIPCPDYYISGSMNFHGGHLRIYNNDSTTRMNFSNVNGAFDNMTIGTPPIINSLSGGGVDYYPIPFFDNVKVYYSLSHGGYIGRNTMQPPSMFYGIDPLYHTSRYGNLFINQDYETDSTIGVGNYVVDRTNWTAYCTRVNTGSWELNNYLLTAGITGYWDQQENPGLDPTSQLGRVIKISGDTLYLDQVGLNAVNGQYRVYISQVHYLQP